MNFQSSLQFLFSSTLHKWSSIDRSSKAKNGRCICNFQLHIERSRRAFFYVTSQTTLAKYRITLGTFILNMACRWWDQLFVVIEPFSMILYHCEKVVCFAQGQFKLASSVFARLLRLLRIIEFICSERLVWCGSNLVPVDPLSKCIRPNRLLCFGIYLLVHFSRPSHSKFTQAFIAREGAKLYDVRNFQSYDRNN